MKEEEIHLQLVLELLPRTVEQDATTGIQAHCLMAVYYYVKGQTVTARYLLFKAVDTVQRHSLHIGPNTGHLVVGVGDEESFGLPYPSTVVSHSEEARNALLQLLYLDRAFELMLRLPPLVPQQLRNEFQTFTVRQLSELAL